MAPTKSTRERSCSSFTLVRLKPQFDRRFLVPLKESSIDQTRISETNLLRRCLFHRAPQDENLDSVALISPPLLSSDKHFSTKGVRGAKGVILQGDNGTRRLFPLILTASTIVCQPSVATPCSDNKH